MLLKPISTAVGIDKLTFFLCCRSNNDAYELKPYSEQWLQVWKKIVQPKFQYISGSPIPASADPVSLPWQCNFESGLCGMIQRTDDEFDWTRHRAVTPSYSTGPSGATSRNWYIYIETSSPRVPGDAAVIQLAAACYHCYSLFISGYAVL